MLLDGASALPRNRPVYYTSNTAGQAPKNCREGRVAVQGCRPQSIRVIRDELGLPAQATSRSASRTPPRLPPRRRRRLATATSRTRPPGALSAPSTRTSRPGRVPPPGRQRCCQRSSALAGPLPAPPGLGRPQAPARRGGADPSPAPRFLAPAEKVVVAVRWDEYDGAGACAWPAAAGRAASGVRGRRARLAPLPPRVRISSGWPVPA